MKSPETARKQSKTKNSGKSTNTEKSTNDIRKYITVTGANTSKPKDTERSRLKSLPNSSEKPLTQSGNIVGFTNLTGNKVKGTKNAGSSTYVITKKGTTNSTTQSFAGVGRSLSASSLPSQDYATVREHWLKKFDKRGNTAKAPKKAKVECPVCNSAVDSETFDKHLDRCLENPKNHTKECIICATPVPSVDYESHVNRHFDSRNDQTTPCLACGKQIVKTDLSSHLEDCMSISNVFDTSHVGVEEVEEPNKTYHCPYCLRLVEEGRMQIHIDACLKSSEGVECVNLLLSSDSDFDD